MKYRRDERIDPPGKAFERFVKRLQPHVALAWPFPSHPTQKQYSVAVASFASRD
jgi:hypothetical protein